MSREDAMAAAARAAEAARDCAHHAIVVRRAPWGDRWTCRECKRDLGPAVVPPGRGTW